MFSVSSQTILWLIITWRTCLKTVHLGPTTRNSDLINQGQGLGIFLFNKHPHTTSQKLCPCPAELFLSEPIPVLLVYLTMAVHPDLPWTFPGLILCPRKSLNCGLTRRIGHFCNFPYQPLQPECPLHPNFCISTCQRLTQPSRPSSDATSPFQTAFRVPLKILRAFRFSEHVSFYSIL